jgi:hypothetical protein
MKLELFALFAIVAVITAAPAQIKENNVGKYLNTLI